MKTPTGLTFRVRHECGNEIRNPGRRLNPLEQSIREMSKLQTRAKARDYILVLTPVPVSLDYFQTTICCNLANLSRAVVYREIA